MFQKLSASWDLVRAAAAVLRQDRELLVLPVLSLVSTLLVLATFFLPLVVFRNTLVDPHNPLLWLLALLFYFSQYFIIFFFNAALVAAAQMRFRGVDPTLSDALSAARDVAVPLLGYAAIAATVGLLLRALEERVGWVGRLLAGLAGVGWTLTTFLVVPVIVHRNTGPIDALGESAHLLKKTWGENLVGNFGIQAIFGLGIALLAFAGIGTCMLLMGVSKVLAVVAFAVTIAAMLSLAVYQVALSGIFQAALYQFAQTGQLPQGFTQEQIDSAFRRPPR